MSEALNIEELHEAIEYGLYCSIDEDMVDDDKGIADAIIARLLGLDKEPKP